MRKAAWKPKEEMEAFYRLPERVRNALNNGPTKYIHLHHCILDFIEREGVDRAARLIRAGKFGSRMDITGN